MANLPIASAAALTGAQTASGDLFPLLDVSAAAGSQGSKITRDELGDAMTRTAALIAALAAKLDKAGGTMTGALAITQGAANTAVLSSTGYSLTGSNATGMIDLAGTLNTTGVPRVFKLATTVTAAGAGSKLLEVLGSSSGSQNVFSVFGAANQNNTACLQVGSYFIGDYSGNASFWWGTTNNPYAAQVGFDYQGVRVFNGGAFAFANDAFASASEDLVLVRSATASLQLGRNHATTATTQKIKAHNVTTGTGANLVLAGGTGSVAGGAAILATSTTTGAPEPVVSALPNSVLAFFTSSGAQQVNTSVSTETHSAGMSTAVTEDSTFGGYTIGQVVTALKLYGLLG